jgi:hypothetical protein
LALGLALTLPQTFVLTQPRYVTYGPITIDGNYGDWGESLTSGWSWNLLFEDGDNLKFILAHVYLRYDCSTQTMYVFIWPVSRLSDRYVPSFVHATRTGANWASLDGSAAKVFTDMSGTDGTPPDFEYWNFDDNKLPVDGAAGFEASFTMAPGSHTLRVQTEMYRDGWRTARNVNTKFVVNNCTTAVSVGGFAATRTSSRVTLSWTTGSEIDIVGFNVWRSTRPDDGFIKLNASLIAATNPGGLAGAAYSFNDGSGQSSAPSFYRLEVIGTDDRSRTLTLSSRDGPR